MKLVNQSFENFDFDFENLIRIQIFITEQPIGDLRKHFLCQIQVCAAYRRGIDPLLRCNFYLCYYHKTNAIDGMEHDSETSIEKNQEKNQFVRLTIPRIIPNFNLLPLHRVPV